MRNILLCLLLALGLSACDAMEEDTPERYAIGVLLPLSGPLGPNGDAAFKGMELARDEVNASSLLGNDRLEFITYDDQSSLDLSHTQATELIEEQGVPVILGPFTSSDTQQITPELDNAGVIALSPTSAAAGLGAASPYLFRSTLPVNKMVSAGIATSKRHWGYRRAATVVNTADVFSKSSHDEITSTLSHDPDISIVSEIAYARDQSSEDFPDILPELIEMKTADPDVIFISGLAPDRVEVILQAHAVGIMETPFIVPLLSIDEVNFINREGDGAAENAMSFNVWLADSEHPRSLAFLNSYQNRYAEQPSSYAARGYAAVHILANALAQVERFEADAIRDVLAKTRDLDTVFGSFSFGENGDAEYDPVVAQVKDDAFVIIK